VTKNTCCCACGLPPNLKRSQDVVISGLTTPSPEKIPCESCAYEWSSQAPGSEAKPVIAPFSMSTSPYPGGTTIFDPFVMTLTDARTFDPRPAFVPRGTAGKTAAVGARPSGMVRKSFHWSANEPPSAPTAA
jgi:hypothetical protein